MDTATTTATIVSLIALTIGIFCLIAQIILDRKMARRARERYEIEIAGVLPPDPNYLDGEA